MMGQPLSRRQLAALLAGAAAAPLLPRPARAAGSVIAATFPNAWEDAYRRILVPLLAEKGTELVVAPVLAQDQLAKMMASPGRPAYDALLMSPGQSAQAIANGLIDKVDPARIPNWSKVDPALQSPWGPTVTVEVNGIAYNPDVVPKPNGYKDLFENPAYDGKVAWIGFGSNTATMAWVEIAKLYGGSEDNMQPMFDLLARHLPKIGAIANNGSHQMTLYQQDEIAVFMASTNNVAHLKSLGLPCAFAHPESGSPAVPVNIHLSKGTANAEGVYAYMDAAISQAAQDQLKLPPTGMIPTNRDVVWPEEILAYVKPEQMPGFAYADWEKINKHRGAWTAEFDRIVKA